MLGREFVSKMSKKNASWLATSTPRSASRSASARARIKADAPVLRPDDPVPANPVL